ncbi:uncharacterized protein LOC141694693 [Apium graveolens]|uniref:uncharacterized protein LOC141694693 n=1 Tax=Apium graveolens TaxID=4045 RepID=UPI003D7BF91F
MVGYRGAKDATFAGEDWLVRWFIDIGKWARFCSDLDGLVDDSVDIASEADYMAWYADISRMRIGKPDPQPQQQYKTRELYDSLEGYEVMVVGLNMLKQLDARVPPEFMEEFGRISATFLTPFSRLMKKIKGPAYRPPTFQNIKPDFIAPLADDFDIPAIPAQDVVDMTQPSQHVSQPPQAIASSSRPAKLASRRMKEEKWSITKSLSMTKKNAIYSDWGWGFGMAPRNPGGLSVQDYHVHASAMQSLAPGTWVDDRIIYTYMGLLRTREEEIHTRGIWERKPVYYFMDPYFMVLGKGHLKKIRKASRVGGDTLQRAWNKALRSFTGFSSATVGPSVLEADYIFIPCCVGDVHWVLFMFGTRRFEGLIIDSMNDEPDYREDIRVVSWLLPRLLHMVHPVEGLDPTSAEVLALPSRPKQRNSNDCGVYVMKYMDYFTQGYDLAEVPNWSQEEVDTFRYRIARELQLGKARGIPGIRMRRRHEASWISFYVVGFYLIYLVCLVLGFWWNLVVDLVVNLVVNFLAALFSICKKNNLMAPTAENFRGPSVLFFAPENRAKDRGNRVCAN